MREQLIRISGLTKAYGSGETAVHALDGIELDGGGRRVPGDHGSSGCGKSTLLNMIGALTSPPRAKCGSRAKTWRGSRTWTRPCADGRLRFSTAQLAADPDRARERRDAHAGTEHRRAQTPRSRSLDLLKLVGLEDRRPHAQPAFRRAAPTHRRGARPGEQPAADPGGRADGFARQPGAVRRSWRCWASSTGRRARPCWW